jgi:quinol monooxygenase YgiN
MGFALNQTGDAQKADYACSASGRLHLMARMKRLSSFVSIHPYFKILPGQEAAFKALLPAFRAKTAPEKGTLFYEFTVNGDEVFCREGYVSAEAALSHIANVRALLEEGAKFSTMTRLEVHGPAAELAKMKQPLAELKVVWFALES